MTATEANPEPATLEIRARGPDTICLRLSGPLEASGLAGIWHRATRRLERAKAAQAIVEAEGVTHFDAMAAAMLIHIQEIQESHGGTMSLQGLPERFQPVLDLFLKKGRAPREPVPEPGLVESVGRRAVRAVHGGGELIAFVGQLTVALLAALRHPRRVRWRDTMRAAQIAGVDSFPVVVLVSGLLGLVMGFQSALQLQRFGADIYLANLVGLSMVRELGPLMTAVVLTARSGSAFAAELGSMRINEEVDALTTMGVDPIRFLVTPRVVAAVVMTPILTVFANIAGILGGAVVWVSTLGLATPAYFIQLNEAIRVQDILGGLSKAFVFGVLVAAVGCLRGMQTRGGASAVGHATTSAVVSGIVLIAITDGLFSIVFYALGI